jgi:hypothetical protein
MRRNEVTCACLGAAYKRAQCEHICYYLVMGILFKEGTDEEPHTFEDALNLGGCDSLHIRLRVILSCDCFYDVSRNFS